MFVKTGQLDVGREQERERERERERQTEREREGERGREREREGERGRVAILARAVSGSRPGPETEEGLQTVRGE